MDGSFQVQDLIYSLIKRIKFLVIVPLLFAGIGLLLSLYVITPIYQAQSDLLVNQTRTDSGLPSATDVEMNLRLIETYQFILQSPRISELVVESLDQKYSIETLRENLKVKTNQDSQIISLFVEDTDPVMASKIVNLYATIFQQEISKLMHLNNVGILTEAKTDTYLDPVRPKPILYTILLFLIGSVFAIIYVLLAVYFNSKVYTKNDVERNLGIPLLGTIGRFSKRKPSKKKNSEHEVDFIHFISRVKNNKAGFEAYRGLRTNILFQSATKKLQSILITSSEKNEGKTVSAGNLAIVMAMDNKRTVFIDADLRKAAISYSEDFANKKGLTTYLAGYATIDEIVSHTSMTNLSIINSGPIPPNPTELLSSLRMDTLLAELEAKFDIIIIDSPPMFFSDPAILATKVDGCLFISNAGVTKTNHAQQAIEQLKNVNATVIGAVLNNKKEKKKAADYYNYGN